MISGNQYLEALIRGEQELINEIYQQCFPAVQRFVVTNKGNEQDAQDTFHRALLQISIRYRREAFEIRVNFHQYLFVVCKNLWRRELNRSKNQSKDLDSNRLYTEAQDNAIAVLEQQRFELFEEKFDFLSANCRNILKLYFSKISYAEIVERSDYESEAVARQRVFKCKKKLSDLIKGDKRFLSLKEL